MTTYQPRPFTHRGYRWQPEELELFRVFKRDGAIARQARPTRYAIDIAEGPGYATRIVRLWKRTHGPYERIVACFLVRDNQWPTA